MVLGFLTLCALSPRLVPFSMDEFVHYHALGCGAFPLQREYPLGVEACGSYDLTPPGFTRPLPLRSYLYIGSLPVVPFYPLWRLVGAAWVVRLQGGLYFWAATLLVARLARVRVTSALLASLVFPVYLVSYVVDVGPVGLSLALLAMALIELRASLAESAPRMPLVRAALGGLALFAGLWVKLVFAWTLPALALCAVYWAKVALQRGATWRRVLAPIALFGLAAALPTALLLASTDVEGLPYYAVGSGSGLNLGRRLLKNAVHDVGRYLVDASLAVNPVGVLPHTVFDYVPLIGGLTLVGLLVATRARTALLWLACGVLTFLVTLVSGGVWGPHHLAFSLLFLVVAMASGVDQLRLRWSWAGRAVVLVLLVSWTALLVRLPHLQAPSGTGFAKDRLLASVRQTELERRDIVLHATWGTYYIGHLFGDHEQVVLAIGDLEQARPELAHVRALAARLGRGIAVVSAGLKPEAHSVLRETFGAPVAEQAFEEWQLLEFRP
jgi:hypothetical protein